MYSALFFGIMFILLNSTAPITQEVPSVVVKILSLIFKQHVPYRPKTTIKCMLVVLFT